MHSNPHSPLIHSFTQSRLALHYCQASRPPLKLLIPSQSSAFKKSPPSPREDWLPQFTVVQLSFLLSTSAGKYLSILHTSQHFHCTAHLHFASTKRSSTPSDSESNDHLTDKEGRSTKEETLDKTGKACGASSQPCRPSQSSSRSETHRPRNTQNHLSMVPTRQQSRSGAMLGYARGSTQKKWWSCCQDVRGN
jgi:hypothetical protein